MQDREAVEIQLHSAQNDGAASGADVDALSVRSLTPFSDESPSRRVSLAPTSTSDTAEGGRLSALEDRRNSPSKIDTLRATLVATGARFRPPFTPSNSLLSLPPSKAKMRKKKPGEIKSSARARDDGCSGRVGVPPPERAGIGVTQMSQSVSSASTQRRCRKNADEKKWPLMRSSSVRPLNRPSTRDSQQRGDSPNGSFAHSMRASSSNLSTSNSSFTTSKKYAHVKSRVDANSDYTPPQSRVKIFHQPLKINAAPKVGSLQNASHVPGGGNVKIENRRLQFSEVKPRIDAKSTVEIPVSNKKIFSERPKWKAEPKVGSLANSSHEPTGGRVKIFNEKLRFDAVQSRVGSLENAGHVPGGGDIKILEYSVRSASRSANRRSPAASSTYTRNGHGNSSNNSRRSSSVSTFHRSPANGHLNASTT